MTTTAVPQVSARRRRTDKVMRASLLVATLIALVPLFFVVYYLLKKGLGAVTGGAIALNWALIHPVPFVALVLVALVGMLGAVAKTTWRPPDPTPIRRRRQGGRARTDRRSPPVWH